MNRVATHAEAGPSGSQGTPELSRSTAPCTRLLPSLYAVNACRKDLSGFLLAAGPKMTHICGLQSLSSRVLAPPPRATVAPQAPPRAPVSTGRVRILPTVNFGLQSRQTRRSTVCLQLKSFLQPHRQRACRCDADSHALERICSCTSA